MATGGITFNGSSQYLELADKVVGAYPLTMVLWAASDLGGSATECAITQGSTTADSFQFGGFESVSNNKYASDRAAGTSSTATRSASPDISNSAFGLLVAVLEATRQTIYYNSNVGTTNTATPGQVFSDLNRTLIGAARNSSGVTGHAKMTACEAHFFNVALTSSDVTTLLTTKPEDVAGWVDGWTLANNSTLTSIGGSRTLTAVGSPTTGSVTLPYTRAAAPVLTSPTATVAATTTATVGATVPIATGTLRAVITSSTIAPNTTQVLAGQDHTSSTSGVLSGSLAITSTGAKTFNISGLTSGTTRHVYLALEDAGGNSAVVYAGAIYPSTWRVASDVTVTGWVITGAATHAAALNEDTADDGTFTTSPALSGTPSSITMALDEPRPAGTYTERIRVNVSSGAGNCRVVALNDAGTVQGQTADQSITSTLTTYTLPLTQSGTATRLRVDVWI